MSYDDLKQHAGRLYSGMAIGGRHSWEYPNGHWDERKVAPDRWEFTFSSVKKRTRGAPEGSGAPPGTQFHWYLLAHQRVRKLDQDAYETFMQGVKYKLAHKRPHWKMWNTEYPGNRSERELLIGILEDTLQRLRAEEPELPPAAAALPSPAAAALQSPAAAALPSPAAEALPFPAVSMEAALH